MNHYELLTLVSGRFAENEVESELQKIEAIVKKYDCPIHYRQNLGHKRLAYPIDRELYGYYFLMEFDAEPGSIAKVDRELKLAADVLRHTIVKRKTVGKPKTAERKTSLEQEAFGKSFDRKTLGFDELPAVIIPEKSTAPSVPVVIDAKGEKTPEVSEPAVGQQPAAVPSEPSEQGELVHPQEEEKLAEKKTAKPKEKPSSTGKIEDKVSFEELDKKLEDILKNDLL